MLWLVILTTQVFSIFLYHACISFTCVVYCYLGCLTFVVTSYMQNIYNKSKQPICILSTHCFGLIVACCYNYIQFDCCGVNGPKDWVIYNLPYCLANQGLPKSCACSSTDSDSCFVVHIGGYTFSSWTKVSTQVLTSFSFLCDNLAFFATFRDATKVLLILSTKIAVPLEQLSFCWPWRR